MNKCNPVDMRKNLEIVDMLKRVGIDFVPIPVAGKFSKSILVSLMKQNLEEIDQNLKEEPEG